jgi:hypothetical protein
LFVGVGVSFFVRDEVNVIWGVGVIVCAGVDVTEGVGVSILVVDMGVAVGDGEDKGGGFSSPSHLQQSCKIFDLVLLTLKQLGLSCVIILILSITKS